MRLGERHPLGRQLIELRGGDLAVLRIEAVDVTVAKIVGEDENDVGFGGGLCGERYHWQQGGAEDGIELGWHGGCGVWVEGR